MAHQKIQKALKDLQDILVGKVTLPNERVDQITFALLYKFMDDMDRAGIEMGGVASFFSGEYEKYSWTRIMSNNIGAQQRFNLYTEGLEKMSINSSLPDTFRSIFKEARVPYREAETLTSFLRIIDDNFDYNEDSEQLGDAYELLLNVLSSSGDLGMFRTPRHIIDFIVSLVEPDKDDRILDPACGTAGFLISAYKYILNKNLDDKGKSNLTFDEKTKILHNISGYDIAPSMVKISEMNMFLHGAAEPKIYEYDTLTFDDRWGDKFECILANPPFMTPKGGIVPHNKFSVKSSKSEILFVDYIANHLTSQGKAGIIVPDGVVFKGDKAFTTVRKDLVENSLWAVISLPSGIFQPYAAVSTYILLLDKKLAKEKDVVLFADLKNDGYSLTTQRREIKENDIPGLLEEFLLAKNDDSVELKNVVRVSKKKIVDNNYDLSISKYIKKEITKVDYEEPSIILERIEDYNEEFSKLLSEIKGE